MTTLTSLATADQNESGDFSVWSRKFKITSFKSDPWRWNKDWDKVLYTLSSRDVYTMMGQMYQNALDPSELLSHSLTLRDSVRRVQDGLVKEWDEMEETRQFVTAWLLLDEGERKRHLLKGMEEACQEASLHQDPRALCPEITISSMLKQNGRAFIDFVNAFRKGQKEVSDGTPYFLPSEWWDEAMEGPHSISERFAESTFTILTLQRNEFISLFLALTVLSVVHDFCYGSAGMDPVTNLMKSDPVFARAWSKTVSGVRDKPVIRCENCTKSTEEIGRNVKFMLQVETRFRCALLFTKSFSNYAQILCRACQKEDWRKHKKHCGKSRVSKKLPGTVHDRLWAHPEVPEYARYVHPDQQGNIELNSTGFGIPDAARTYSPALQRQVSLITANKNADYFLFDMEDRPICFVLPDPWMRMTFRNIRADVLSGEDGIGAIGEYLIKVMEQKPGLSRDIILGQLEREYGSGVTAKVAEWERMSVENGHAGSTFVEVMSRNLTGKVPMVARG